MNKRDYIVALTWGIAGTIIVGLCLLMGYWIKPEYNFLYTPELRNEMTMYAELSPVTIVIFAGIVFFGKKKDSTGDDRD
jgi:hypothetical protein